MNSFPSGSFVTLDGERWYRIGDYDRMAPFFIALTGDSDLWAFVSTNGSLAAGRGDPEHSFFPYETVDKIHNRWETTGPRTWIRSGAEGQTSLWEPFARRPGAVSGARNLYKNRTGTRLIFEEIHPAGNLCFRQEWSSSGGLGLVRKASLCSLVRPEAVQVLDGLVNLLPAGLTNATYSTFSSLADAYKWNEGLAAGRLGVFTMYAQLWDRAEPKESLEALTVWSTGPRGVKTLLSPRQIESFAAGEEVETELLTRGQRSAYLMNFEAKVEQTDLVWYQVVDGPLSQARTADLAARLERGEGTPQEIEAALKENTRGLDELLDRADGFQSSGNEMPAVHHTANVLFNIMRGGVFPSGTSWDRDDLTRFVVQRNRAMAEPLNRLLAGLEGNFNRQAVLEAARRSDPQLERLVREYLPLTFSRRHGDPSRPWNKFSIRVRDAQGQRVMNHQGNWRDIFQNWEALAASQPEYLGSMISTFLSAMTADGYNPYRITRDGIDWETIEADDPWSFIGYWGDHQVVYLLKFLEAAQAMEPGLLADLWQRPVFAFADVPYRIKSYAEISAHPKATIDFDHEAHRRIMARATSVGADGKLIPDAQGTPVLATLAEKLVTILVSKFGNLIPGGGIWMNTQRPEWNDANNALVGNGLSLVTLGAFRRLMVFLQNLPFLDEAFDLPEETAAALEALEALSVGHSLNAVTDPSARRLWMDRAGSILEDWRVSLYAGWSSRTMRKMPFGTLRSFLRHIMPWVDSTLNHNLRTDGLYHSYNLLTLSLGKAEVSYLYPMLEGQVAILSSGLLDPAQAVSLGKALKDSAIFDKRRNSYLLYPDRRLPGFLEKNVLDDKALALEPVQNLLKAGRRDLLEVQADGKVRFAPQLANRYDVEAALSGDLGAAAVADAYDRLLGHKEFTGRSGAMFGYEGLGCIYWHMVAKLLLAVQEIVFSAADQKSPHLEALKLLYRDIRSGLGYHKTPAEYGAFPFDPYSHTAGEGGAQQPGMTGQVKEEILTRWGELGLRWKQGKLSFNPILLDREEIPVDGCLEFTYQRIPFSYSRGAVASVKVQTAAGWSMSTDVIPLAGALKVVAVVTPL